MTTAPLRSRRRCVVWEAFEEPWAAATTCQFVTTVSLSGTLPAGMHAGARRCLGTYRRRDRATDGGECLTNGRHTYVKADDGALMLWFAHWPHDVTSEQYTGWYVGNSADLGHCRGFLMAPSSDVALRPSALPSTWSVGRAGPGSGYEPAPGIRCTVPGVSGGSSTGAQRHAASGSSAGGGGAAAGGAEEHGLLVSPGTRARSGGRDSSGGAGSGGSVVGSKRRR